MWLVTGEPQSTLSYANQALSGVVPCGQASWADVVHMARYSSGVVASLAVLDDAAVGRLVELRRRAPLTPIIAVVQPRASDLWNASALPVDHLVPADDLGQLASRVCRIGPSGPRYTLIKRIRHPGVVDQIRGPVLCGLEAEPSFGRVEELAEAAFMSPPVSAVTTGAISELTLAGQLTNGNELAVPLRRGTFHVPRLAVDHSGGGSHGRCR